MFLAIEIFFTWNVPCDPNMHWSRGDAGDLVVSGEVGGGRGGSPENLHGPGLPGCLAV